MLTSFHLGRITLLDTAAHNLPTSQAFVTIIQAAPHKIKVRHHKEPPHAIFSSCWIDDF